MAHPPSAYQVSSGSDEAERQALYAAIANAERDPVERFTLPIRSGRAWQVPAGHVFRIEAVEGPQVGDLNIWNAHNPREHMWAARTRQLQAAHVTTYDRIWSTLPYLRPLATITADSLSHYGEDSEGGRVHDLLGTRCDPYVNKILSGDEFDYHCHSNLTRAVLPHGLTEFDVHDVLNVFQCTGLNDADEYFMKACPATQGDYLEFFAEIDLLCALSTCPGGDLSVPLWGPNARDPIDTCRPLSVAVDAINPSVIENRWQQPVVADYGGQHGLKAVPHEET